MIVKQQSNLLVAYVYAFATRYSQHVYVRLGALWRQTALCWVERRAAGDKYATMSRHPGTEVCGTRTDLLQEELITQVLLQNFRN